MPLITDVPLKEGGREGEREGGREGVRERERGGGRERGDGRRRRGRKGCQTSTLMIFLLLMLLLLLLFLLCNPFYVHFSQDCVKLQGILSLNRN